jgi:hypothetical protein
LLFMGYIHMEQMTVQELANMAWALATMRARPGAVWLARLHVQVVAKARAMGAQEIANTAWAVQQIAKAQQGVTTSQAATAPSLQLAGHHVDDMGAVWHALLQSAASKVKSFRSQELLMLLMSAQEFWSARSHSRRQTDAVAMKARQYYDVVLLHAAHTLLQPGAASLSTTDVANVVCMVAKSVSSSAAAATTSALCTSPWDSAMGRLGKAHAVAAAVDHLHDRPHHFSLKVWSLMFSPHLAGQLVCQSLEIRTAP